MKHKYELQRQSKDALTIQTYGTERSAFAALEAMLHIANPGDNVYLKYQGDQIWPKQSAEV